MLSGVPLRRASAMARLTRSLSSARFGNWVRKSCCAWCARRVFNAWAALTSRQMITAPLKRPSLLKMGAAASSIGTSLPSWRTRTMPEGRACVTPLASTCSTTPLSGMRLMASAMQNTSSAGRPYASSRLQPVSATAAAFR